MYALSLLFAEGLHFGVSVKAVIAPPLNSSFVQGSTAGRKRHSDILQLGSTILGNAKIHVQLLKRSCRMKICAVYTVAGWFQANKLNVHGRKHEMERETTQKKAPFMK